MRRSIFILGFLLFSCSQPKVTPVIAPDGSPALFVECGGDEARCYRLAGERCPHGYDLGRTARGSGFLVRCRTAWIAPPAPVPTPLVATAAPTAPPASPTPTSSVPVSTFPPASTPPLDPVGY